MNVINTAYDYKNDKFANLLGIEITEAGNGMAKGQLALKPHCKNALGTAHGGVMFALLDVVAACAAFRDNQVRVVEFSHINYIKIPPRETTLHAEVRLHQTFYHDTRETYVGNITDDEETLICSIEIFAKIISTNLESKVDAGRR